MNNIESFQCRAVELSPGDVICYMSSEINTTLKPGEIFNFQGVKTLVTLVIKDPPHKKWYQFWIKPKVVGYHLQVLPDWYKKKGELWANQ